MKQRCLGPLTLKFPRVPWLENTTRGVLKTSSETSSMARLVLPMAFPPKHQGTLRPGQ